MAQDPRARMPRRTDNLIGSVLAGLLLCPVGIVLFHKLQLPTVALNDGAVEVAQASEAPQGPGADAPCKLSPAPVEVAKLELPDLPMETRGVAADVPPPPSAPTPAPIADKGFDAPPPAAPTEAPATPVAFTGPPPAAVKEESGAALPPPNGFSVPGLPPANAANKEPAPQPPAPVTPPPPPAAPPAPPAPTVPQAQLMPPPDLPATPKPPAFEVKPESGPKPAESTAPPAAQLPPVQPLVPSPAAPERQNPEPAPALPEEVKVARTPLPPQPTEEPPVAPAPPAPQVVQTAGLAPKPVEPARTATEPAKTTRVRYVFYPLTGSYSARLDEKHGLTLPKSLQSALHQPRVVYLTPGAKSCLQLTNIGGLERQVASLETARQTPGELNAAQRLHYSQTERLKVDDGGRVQLTPALLKAAGLQQEVVILGVGTHFEVWDAARWRDYSEAQKSAGR